MTIRILLAEDHTMIREALRKSLAAEADIEVVGDCGTGRETLNLMTGQSADILILDIGFPDISGIDVARQVAARNPAIRILALSGYADPFYIDEMLKAGARGYVLKSAGTLELLAAIRAVAAGGGFFSGEVARVMAKRLNAEADAEPGAVPVSRLGKREREVLRLLADGKRAPDIAICLGISLGTVEAHRRNIKQKLGLHTTAELTRYAIRQGLISI